MPSVWDEITRAKLVAVLRMREPAALVTAADRAMALGVRVIEITTTSPGWERAIDHIAGSPDSGVTVGAGTVLTADHARRAVAAGAAFLVSPALPAPEVIQAAEGTPLAPGGFTPTEIAHAHRVSGLVKLFPASSGGMGHLRALLDIFPGVRIMPTGGLGVPDVEEWLDAGAAAIGLGSALLRVDANEVRALLSRLDNRDS